MARRSTGGLIFFGIFCAGVAAYLVASHLGYVDRLAVRVFPSARKRVTITPGDFPAGVSAPVGDIASIPLRPTLIGFTPRASAAGLLAAAGGATVDGKAVVEHGGEGVFKTAYALETRALLFDRDDDLRRALAAGGEAGGVDMAIMSVDQLVRWNALLRDAAPRAELLIGRSRGQDALAAVGAPRLVDLKGKRLAIYPASPAFYFALWALSRGGLTLADVRWVDLASTDEAGRALREGRADAAVGLAGDVELAARDRGGGVLTSTADAPHLIATVLVARGDFAARYPDDLRRVLRGLLDASEAIHTDPGPAARILGDVAPFLGDPAEAIRLAPPADLKDNLAFFGLAGEAPVTYDELFRSAAELFLKVGKIRELPPVDETRDLAALKYVSQARGP